MAYNRKDICQYCGRLYRKSTSWNANICSLHEDLPFVIVPLEIEVTTAGGNVEPVEADVPSEQSEVIPVQIEITPLLHDSEEIKTEPTEEFSSIVIGSGIVTSVDDCNSVRKIRSATKQAAAKNVSSSKSSTNYKGKSPAKVSCTRSSSKNTGKSPSNKYTTKRGPTTRRKGLKNSSGKGWRGRKYWDDDETDSADTESLTDSANEFGDERDFGFVRETQPFHVDDSTDSAEEEDSYNCCSRDPRRSTDRGHLNRADADGGSTDSAEEEVEGNADAIDHTVVNSRWSSSTAVRSFSGANDDCSTESGDEEFLTDSAAGEEEDFLTDSARYDECPAGAAGKEMNVVTESLDKQVIPVTNIVSVPVQVQNTSNTYILILDDSTGGFCNPHMLNSSRVSYLGSVNVQGSLAIPKSDPKLNPKPAPKLPPKPAITLVPTPAPNLNPKPALSVDPIPDPKSTATKKEAKKKSKEVRPKKLKLPKKLPSLNAGFRCGHEDCAEVTQRYKDRHQYRVHLKDAHHVPDILDCVTLTFNSMNDFEKWKIRTEKESMCRYVRQVKSKIKGGGLNYFYYCHRSGRYVTTSAGVRRVRSKGTCKIGHTCPATILVDVKDKVIARFYPTHFGHHKELKYTYLTKEDRLKIAGFLARGESPASILQYFLSTSADNDRLQRQQLVTRKAIANVHRSALYHKADFPIPEETIVSLEVPCVTSAVNNRTVQAQDLLSQLSGLVDQKKKGSGLMAEVLEHLSIAKRLMDSACTDSVDTATRIAEPQRSRVIQLPSQKVNNKASVDTDLDNEVEAATRAISDRGGISSSQAESRGYRMSPKYRRIRRQKAQDRDINNDTFECETVNSENNRTYEHQICEETLVPFDIASTIDFVPSYSGLSDILCTEANKINTQNLSTNRQPSVGNNVPTCSRARIIRHNNT